MDLFEFIVVLCLITCIPLSVGIFKRDKRGVKRTKDAVEDQILKVKESIIGTYQKELQRAHGRANRYKQQLDEYEEIPENEGDIVNGEAKFEDIKALVKKIYPQAGKLLDLPFAKKEVSKLTKGMSLEEIIGMVEEFTGKKVSDNLGSKQDTSGKSDTTGYF